MLTVVPDLSVSLPADGLSSSLIDQIVREGARQMLAAALRAEVVAYIGQFADGAGLLCLGSDGRPGGSVISRNASPSPSRARDVRSAVTTLASPSSRSSPRVHLV